MLGCGLNCEWFAGFDPEERVVADESRLALVLLLHTERGDPEAWEVFDIFIRQKHPKTFADKIQELNLKKV